MTNKSGHMTTRDSQRSKVYRAEKVIEKRRWGEAIRPS